MVTLSHFMRLPVLVGIGLLFAQILLGVGYPLTMPVGHAQEYQLHRRRRFSHFQRIQFVSEIGPNYEGGQLEHGARAHTRSIGPVPSWSLLLASFVGDLFKRGANVS